MAARPRQLGGCRVHHLGGVHGARHLVRQEGERRHAATPSILGPPGDEAPVVDLLDTNTLASASGVDRSGMDTHALPPVHHIEPKRATLAAEGARLAHEPFAQRVERLRAYYSPVDA